MNFSIVLKDLLFENNISQAKLAESIGFSQRAVSKWVNAQAEPTETAIISCANFFGITTDEMLGKNDFGSVNIKHEMPTLSEEEQQILEDFRSLPRQEKAQASEYIHYLAEKRGNVNKKHA